MNNDIKAKSLIKGQIEEAGERPPGPGPGGPPRRPMPPRRSMPGGPEDMGGDPVRRMMGREEGPKGQFTPEETSQLKDVLIMILANITHSDLDAQIGQALMNGQELNPGQLQHILDEARQLNIPEGHGQLLQKVFSKLQQR